MAFTPASSIGGGGGGGVVTQGTVPWVVDGSAVVQPVSGAVAVSNFPASQPVTGPLTDAELRAGPVPVDASGATVPISVESLPLPDGAATEETAERAADSLDDVGLTAILERERVPVE